jgi:hypothetical protein
MSEEMSGLLLRSDIMFLPDGGKKILYKYSSGILTINLVMTTENLKGECRLFTIEGPFIGKYHAVLCEDAENIYVISYGKGLFYGRITEENFNKPLFKLNKNMIKKNDTYLFDKYVLSLLDCNSELVIGDKIYSGCMLFNMVYENGKYILYVKEGIGMLLVRNFKDGNTVEEISIREV